MKIKQMLPYWMAAVLVVSCARSPAATFTPASASPTLAAAPTQLISPTETAPPIAAATSRGPNLEATDPSTVSLATGGLQLVEFFRFT
jgi:hypothetical protein